MKTTTKEADMRFNLVALAAGLLALSLLAAPEPARAGSQFAGAFAGLSDARLPVVNAGYYGHRRGRSYRHRGYRHAYGGYRGYRHSYGGYRRSRRSYGYGGYRRHGYGGYRRSYGYGGYRGYSYYY